MVIILIQLRAEERAEIANLEAIFEVEVISKQASSETNEVSEGASEACKATKQTCKEAKQTSARAAEGVKMIA